MTNRKRAADLFTMVILSASLVFSISLSDAFALSVFSTDFNAGAPSEFSGVTTTESVAGLPASFSGSLLRNASTGHPAARTTLSLSGLAAHDSIDLNFLLAIIDSWDGTSGGCCNPDILNVAVDGTSIFSETFTVFGSKPQSYVPPVGVELAGIGAGNLIGTGWSDKAYNMGLDPLFDGITHTASTLTVDWWASGAGWQGGGDESWGIDNVEVVLNTNTVPEPGTLLLMGSGLLGLVGYRIRRKMQG